MSFHKILCPVDFSAGSDAAMRVAIRLAKEYGAELMLAHVWYMPPLAFADGMPFPGDSLQRMIEEEERLLTEAAREATRVGVARVSSKFLTGIPWDRLVATLHDDVAFDLVVMGTHGRTGLRRILLGSVAEKVVRHAPCSVITVHPTDEAKPFQQILCAVDFSPSARHAAELAVALAAPNTGVVTLLHVIELPVAMSGEPLAPDFLGDLDRAAAGRLEKWATELGASSKVRVATRSRIGSPAGQALAILDEDATIDLVATGSHGRTGLGRVLLGSVAEKLVRHAPCPVLVARTRPD
jgi:nucleotide-binding universal stress UspA family protein